MGGEGIYGRVIEGINGTVCCLYCKEKAVENK